MHYEGIFKWSVWTLILARKTCFTVHFGIGQTSCTSQLFSVWYWISGLQIVYLHALQNCTCLTVSQVKVPFNANFGSVLMLNIDVHVAFERFLLTWRYASCALTCCACYAVSAGELHVWELRYVLPPAKPIKGVIIGVSILSSPSGALPLWQERQAAAAARPPVPHGGCGRSSRSFPPTTARLQVDENNKDKKYMIKVTQEQKGRSYLQILALCLPIKAVIISWWSQKTNVAWGPWAS